MKVTLVIALLSAALGAFCGVLAPVRSPEAEPAPAPSEEPREETRTAFEAPGPVPEPVRVAPPEEIAALESELKELRKSPRTWTDAEIAARRKELTDAIHRGKGKDLEELLGQIHELAALGPGGWADALKALKDAAGGLTGADGRLDTLLDGCDGPVLDAMRWALMEPTLRDDDAARTLAVRILARHAGDDERIAPLLLEALAKEDSPGIAALLAGAIPSVFPTAVVPELAPTVSADPSQYPEALMAYMHGLRQSGWTDEEKQHALATLGGHEWDVIADAARATQAAIAARGTGIAIDWVAPDAREAFGLKPGDVIRSVDGEVPSTDEHLWILLSRYGPGTNGSVTVWRDGVEFQYGWAGRRADQRRFSGFAVDYAR